MDFLNKQRIGILGGTFNPVHLGHLLLAQSAYEAFDLSKVIFIPCSKPPHKSSASLLSASHRLNMLDKVIQSDLRFDISTVEIDRGGTSFAIDTVSHLHNQYPDAQLYFIIGTDSLLELHLWKDIHKLLNLCTFLTIERPGDDIVRIMPEDIKLEQPWPERLLQNCAPGRQVNISSSDIRRRLAECMSIHYLVPDSVEMYITEHNLYH